jgi:hypothetical protein
LWGPPVSPCRPDQLWGPSSFSMSSRPVVGPIQFLHVVQTSCGSHPVSYTMDATDSFHERKTDHSPPYSTEVKKM